MSFIFIIVGMIIGAVFWRDAGFLFGGALGFVFGTLFKQGRELKSLRAEFSRLQRFYTEAAANKKAEEVKPTEASETTTSVVQTGANFGASEDKIAESKAPQDPTPDLYPAQQQSPIESVAEQKPFQAKPTDASKKSVDEESPWNREDSSAGPVISTSWIEAGIDWVKRYFTEGNVPVRIGVVVMLFGVSFLLKYAAEHSIIPLEIRLAGVVAAGIVVLLIGWRQRENNPKFGLVMQGGGIGMIYLTVYASFAVYHLIPQVPAMMFMVALVILSCILAVVQSAMALAVLGLTAGFAAPIVLSTGSGNHVVLFSYYLLLDLGVLAIAWYRSWRILNLLAFFFTYAIATAWGVLDYKAHQYATTQPFVILFFLTFVGISVLYALRGTTRLKGIVDGTLVFGTPLMTLVYQTALVERFEYGLAISSTVMAAFYVGLATWLYRSKSKELNTFVESMVSLGIVFMTLTIPFALDAGWTSAAWALEAAGIFWVSVKQKRNLAAVFAILLQLGAGVAFVVEHIFSKSTSGMWLLNATFFGYLLIAFAGIFTAYVADTWARRSNLWQRHLTVPFLLWGALWWIGGGLADTHMHIEQAARGGYFLWFVLITNGLMHLMENRTRWHLMAWSPLVLIAGVFATFAWSTDHYSRLLTYENGTAWIVSLLLTYAVLALRERMSQKLNAIGIVHAVTLIVWNLVFIFETHAQLVGVNGWRDIAPIWPVMLTMAALIRVPVWPFHPYRKDLLPIAGAAMVLAMGLWFAFATHLSGQVAGVPYVPLLNPLDLTTAIQLLLVIFWWLRLSHHLHLNPQNNLVIRCLAVCAFVLLNLVLLRTVHHWGGVPYHANSLWHSQLVQTVLSIAWTLTGLSIMIFAVKRVQRMTWIMGAVLIGLVVGKLFLVDLGASGSIERIVSFIVVGGLLMAVGYWAPIPPQVREVGDTDDDALRANEENSHAE